MKTQDAIRDARALGTPKMLVLGLQHLFAMFGATVLVPILVNSFGLPLSIQTTLLMAGLGTLLFHCISKFKVPAFLGSSFAFLGGYAAIASLNSGKYESSFMNLTPIYSDVICEIEEENKRTASCETVHLVPRVGIEPTTRGFSVPCSTD